MIASFLFLTAGILFSFFISNPSYFMGSAYFFAGGVFMFKSIYLFLPKNAPRIELDENTILIRKALLQKNIIFQWSDLQRVRFNPYRIVFELNDSTTHEVNIETENPDISIRIKSFMRSISNAKVIPVEY